ncbi:small integral membrane protein 34 [Ctenodactylus gundi]
MLHFEGNNGEKGAVIPWTPQGASNTSQASSLLNSTVAARNSTESTKALRLMDGLSAAWYILTIIGVFGVIFLFQLAGNILRKKDKSLEDIYYSNLTFEVKKKGLRSQVDKYPLLIRSATFALPPSQASLVSEYENSEPQSGAKGIP